jgi:hypothetical protein
MVERGKTSHLAKVLYDCRIIKVLMSQSGIGILNVLADWGQSLIRSLICFLRGKWGVNVKTGTSGAFISPVNMARTTTSIDQVVLESRSPHCQ